jgi:hypothetical protein
MTDLTTFQLFFLLISASSSAYLVLYALLDVYRAKSASQNRP